MEQLEWDLGTAKSRQHETALEAPAAVGLIEYARQEFEEKDEFETTPGSLWSECRIMCNNSNMFPQSARSFGHELKRLKKALAQSAGIEVEKVTVGRGNDKRRIYKIRKRGQCGVNAGSMLEGKNDPADYPLIGRKLVPAPGGVNGVILSKNLEGEAETQTGGHGTGDSHPESAKKIDPIDHIDPTAYLSQKTGVNVAHKNDPAPAENDPASPQRMDLFCDYCDTEREFLQDEFGDYECQNCGNFILDYEVPERAA
jgi:hypothetical protein